MSRTALPSVARTVLVLVFLLWLATPAGRQMFVDLATWGGDVYARWILDSLDHGSSSKTSVNTGAAR